MKSSEIFQSLPLGELLTTYSEQYRKEVLQAFIKDLVYMVHPVTSDTECEVKYSNEDKCIILIKNKMLAM